MSKKQRHEKILALISNNDVETQGQLTDFLIEDGFKVTQATVSRDIRALKLSKVSCGNGKQKYIAIKQEDTHLNGKYIRVLKDGFVSMDKAQNILVIKTVSGMAMAVAAAIDSLKFHEVVGCIAGDDTIIVVTRNEESAAGLEGHFSDLTKSY